MCLEFVITLMQQINLLKKQLQNLNGFCGKHMAIVLKKSRIDDFQAVPENEKSFWSAVVVVSLVEMHS